MKNKTTSYEESAVKRYKIFKEYLKYENIKTDEPVSCCIIVPFTFLDDNVYNGKRILKNWLKNNTYDFDELIVTEADFKELVKKSKIKTALLKL